MGEDREWEKQIRDGNVGRDSHRRHWREHGEARCEGKSEPDTKFDVISSTTIPVPYHERKWIDVEPGRFDTFCLEALKLMVRLLRHDDTVPRDNDGAVKFQDLASTFRSEITSSSHWSIRTWLSFLQ